MASSSTFLRRWISSSSQIFRPRMLSTAPLPWLMLWGLCDKEGDIYYRFQCCPSAKIYSFLIKCPLINSKAEFVGSSHGWLALHNSNNKENRDLFLSDPTVPRHIKLPPLHELHRIILSHREEGKAFAISGAAANCLAFCTPQQSTEWTLFGGDGKYESIVYSSSHRRLICLTSTFRLEAWDVAGELPGLDWATQLETPDLHKQPPGLTTLMYLVCWEASGDLFVVVRRLDPSRGRYFPSGAVSEFAHPTVDFEVYKVVDREGRRVARMEASLEGLTMFVGMNHPFAIKGVEGVKPNAIYFAYDKHAGDNIDHRDFGIFDYQKKCVYPQESHYLPDNLVSEPIWFIPH